MRPRAQSEFRFHTLISSQSTARYRAVSGFDIIDELKVLDGKIGSCHGVSAINIASIVKDSKATKPTSSGDSLYDCMVEPTKGAAHVPSLMCSTRL